MADLEFEVAKRRSGVITFTLGKAPADGDTPADTEPYVYTFNPPKSAVMMMPILEPVADKAENNINLTRATFDWLGAGLSEEDNERIKARLRNPKDDLDVDLLGDVVQGLSEKVAARPTT